jgi:hypothetical protein
MYHPYKLKKKNGGHRLIEPPEDKLKNIQTLLNDRLLSHIESPDSIFPRKKVSIKKALEPHQSQPIVICCDISNFFPSIKTVRVREMLQDIGFTSEMANLIIRLTTHNGHVPQGAPTSSSLARLYISEFACNAENYISNVPYSEITIYADDIIISGPVGLKRCLSGIHKIAKRYGLKFNSEKNKIMRDPAAQEALGVSLSPKLHLNNEFVKKANELRIAGETLKYKGMLSYKRHIES